MELTKYMERTQELAVYPMDNVQESRTYCALGLTGEAGEVADLIKKMIRNDAFDNPTMRQRLFYELGDVLWYWVRMCREFGFVPEDVMDGNLDKLFNRKEQGTLKERPMQEDN